MGKATNESVAARQKARERLAKLHADRAARDKRIEDSTTEVLGALDRLGEVDDTHAASVKAAQAAFDAAVSRATAVREKSRAGHDAAVTAAVLALRADSVTVSDIADLTGLPKAEVTRRAASTAAPSPVGAPTVAVADPEPESVEAPAVSEPVSVPVEGATSAA